MEGRMIAVLKKYRADEDPQLRKLKGQDLSTLSKEEINKELEALGIDADQLCVIGGVPNEAEHTCKLLHYALEVAEEPKQMEAGPSSKSDSEPPSKKAKKDKDTVRIIFLV